MVSGVSRPAAAAWWPRLVGCRPASGRAWADFNVFRGFLSTPPPGVVVLDSDGDAIVDSPRPRAAAEVQEHEGGLRRARRARGGGDGAAEAAKAGAGGSEAAAAAAEAAAAAAAKEELIDLAAEEDAAAAEAAATAAGDAAAVPLPMPCFPLGCPDCEACSRALREAHRLHSGMRDALADQRAELLPALRAPLLDLEPGRCYYLVPSAFLADWRDWIAQGGRPKPGAAVLPPPRLAPALRAVLCECHAGAALAYPPPEVENRRGRWCTKEASGRADRGPGAESRGLEAFELVTPEAWLLIQEHYGFDEEEEGGGDRRGSKRQRGSGGGAADEAWTAGGIRAVLHVDGSAEGAPAAAAAAAAGRGGSNGEVAATLASDEVLEGDFVVQRRPRGLPRGSSGGGRGWLETEPPVCADTLAARAEATRAAALCYTNVEVMVEVVAAEEEGLAATAPGAAAAGAAAAGTGVTAGAGRRSKRARKGRAPIGGLDSTSTLADLRLRIYEALDIHPKNARLFAK